MRFFYFFLIALLGSISAFAETYSYSIDEHPYRFSTYFEMRGKDGFVGRAIKHKLSIRTTYDLYNALGQYEAQGVVQSLSLGSLFVWGKDLDIYDASGQRIGMIDGQVLTTASAKYSFYDVNDQLLATAYLDSGCTGFVVMDSKEEKTLAHLKRNFIKDVTDSWDVVIYDPQAIDLRFLKIFSVFAIDYQEYFKGDL